MVSWVGTRGAAKADTALQAAAANCFGKLLQKGKRKKKQPHGPPDRPRRGV
jgi:hypothetical protein